MRIRLKDIARELNVSTVTVSKAIRDCADIGRDTKERVLKRTAELGYRPNFAARSLVTGRTNSVGLVVPSLLHPFFAEVAKGVVQVLRPRGYTLVIAVSDEDPELERSEIEGLVARQIDAVLVASSQNSSDFFVSERMRHTPFVFLDRKVPRMAGAFVGVQDERIGFAATEHLIQGGCRDIAHFYTTPVSSSAGRFEGYKKALQQYGIPFRRKLVCEVPAADKDGESSGYAAINQLLDAGMRIDGIFCFNDPVAAGVLDAVLQRGMQVPDDIAIIGCGNSRWSRLLKVPLSTVDQNSEKLGGKAAEVALRLIREPETPRRSVFLAHQIISRESTRPVLESQGGKHPEKRSREAEALSISAACQFADNAT